ncbi:hypothetical protein GOB93_15795 [Acetobacter musti]|uniref:Uncharacterized protein n=1 Tax=Acetobacter musti TaxID=864732 RepID=A0ABX0JW61_9PROT|nr:hypothetical protein [Acetobacter musti]NHN86092.1 hypothetical protein [Acetobacter musti]
MRPGSAASPVKVTLQFLKMFIHGQFALDEPSVDPFDLRIEYHAFKPTTSSRVIDRFLSLTAFFRSNGRPRLVIIPAFFHFYIPLPAGLASGQRPNSGRGIARWIMPPD